MRVLIVTMLDLEKEPNQRTHHVVAMARALADETVVVFRERAMGRGLRAMLADSLSFRIREIPGGEGATIAVHPPLNYAQAVAAGLVQGRLDATPSPARRALSAVLSLAGIARDLVLVPAMTFAAARRTRGDFDLCIAEGPWSAATAWLLKKAGRVRRILYDDIDFVAGGQMLRIRFAYVAWLERVMAARADALVSVGWKLARFRRRSTGRNALVIPNGVDSARFARARDRSPHPPTLVYVGNIAHYAAIDLAIDAMPRIRRAIPDARLLVVGGGDPPYVEGLKRLAESRGVADAVDFRGPVPYDRVPDVLAESDIGLATFRTSPLGAYAFPLKVVEYMVAGLPFLCTRGSESEEILERHGCGRAIDFDAEALAEAAVALLSDPAGYARCREAAIRGARAFDWRDAMDAMRAVAIATAL